MSVRPLMPNISLMGTDMFNMYKCLNSCSPKFYTSDMNVEMFSMIIQEKSNYWCRKNIKLRQHFRLSLGN